MDRSRSSPQRNLIRFAACLVAIALLVLCVDRPAASWSYAHFHGIGPFHALTHIVDPLRWGAVAGLIVAGLAAACGGWRPGEKGMTFIAACLAIVVSFEIKEGLKLAFGRTWPETWVANNPSWIGSGSFGFHFWHGGEGWASFPSGHMTQITALATVLWHRVRPLRWLWLALPLLVAIGLFGSDYHFLGDMAAGTCLGIAGATGVMALLFR